MVLKNKHIAYFSLPRAPLFHFSSMISYMKINGTEIAFNLRNQPDIQELTKRNKPRQRKTKRILELGRDGTEKELLDLMKRRHFEPNFSSAYFYLKNTIQETPIPLDVLKGMAVFFSHLIEVPIYREYYRRISTLVFWFHNNYKLIRNYTASNEIIIKYNGTEYKFE